MTARKVLAEQKAGANVVSLPGVEFRLTAEYALRAAIDTQVFSALRDLELLDGGRAVQSVYVALLRRLPNVTPDRKRIAIDCGYSESSVKRAIKLLEQCRLMVVKRTKGRSSVYHLADLRSSEQASECLVAIRKLIRDAAGKGHERRRTTSEPTQRPTRVTSEPTARVTSAPRVGSQVDQKEARKDQNKQQRAAAEAETEQGRALEVVLRRFGLSSARYLVKPGHPKAIPLLVENPAITAKLIEQTMAGAHWSPGAGVGARVAYLREHVGDALVHVRAGKRDAVRRQVDASDRARKVAAGLIVHDDVDVSAIGTEHYEVLLQRGLARLDEPPAVLNALAKDRQVSQQIVGDEQLREGCTQQFEAMSPGERRTLCEQLFECQPGLRRLYGKTHEASTGLRLLMIEFLRKQRIEKRQNERRKGEVTTAAQTHEVYDAYARPAKTNRSSRATQAVS